MRLVAKTIIVVFSIFMVTNFVIAKEVTLRAVSAFQEGTLTNRPFERFVEKVNEKGKGVVQIKVVGGPASIPPYELGTALQSGVVDLGFETTAYYTNILPAADALKLSEYPIQELRKNGGWEYLNDLHNKKMNVWFLAEIGDGVPLHLYINKKIDKADLTGMRVRVTALYRAFFEALGASTMNTPASEVYTALEHGVVDGYGWPIQGIIDLGWGEKTKYRVDPGFYITSDPVLVNLDKWKSLNDEQRLFLTEMAFWIEERNWDNKEINDNERKKQADLGIETITLDSDEAAQWLRIAKKAGWDEILKEAPEEGALLQKYLIKEAD